MLKKRIIFTLLYNEGHFVLSRNFRLQKVGNLDWLQRNYDFSKIAFYIDELIVLDVSRGERRLDLFTDTLRQLSKGCFAPIAAGGGIRSVEQARALLHSGADKVVVNTAMFESPELLTALTAEFGQQCIVGSVDAKRNSEGAFEFFTSNGEQALERPPNLALRALPEMTVGEIYLNSMDRDGTGQGYDFAMLELLPDDWATPVILAGGVGNSRHLHAGLLDPRVDAVATAHLFNFVGDGLRKARGNLLAEGFPLADWPALSEIGLAGASSHA